MAAWCVPHASFRRASASGALAGRLADAAALFEEAASTTSEGKARLDALLASARLRLSADPSVRDVRKGEALLGLVMRSSPAVSVDLTVRDLVRVLEDLAELRAQVRALRTDLKSLEADLAKKDEALRRVTSAVVGARPPQDERD